MNQLIYLACPYSHPDKAVRTYRFEQANRYAANMMAAGLLVFSPISHTHPIAESGALPLDWDFWERFDRAYLEMCRAMVVLCLPGWATSKGVAAEIKIMDNLEREVWYVEHYNAECFRQTIRALGGVWPLRDAAGRCPVEVEPKVEPGQQEAGGE